MDLTEQNELAERISNIFITMLGSRDFHAIVAVAGAGDKFSFSVSSLNIDTTFKNCQVIVSGINEETRALLDQFKIPTDERIKRPIEPK